MKSFKLTKRLGLLILTLILAMAMATIAAFAVDENNDGYDDVTGQPINSGDTVPAVDWDAAHVSKIVRYNEHQTFNLTFNYSATPAQLTLTQSYDAATDTTETVMTQPVNACPAVTISPINVAVTGNTVYSADGIRVPKANMTDAEIAANTQGTITFGSGASTGAAAFRHAGVYAYTISETAGATTGFDGHDGGTDNLTYDTQTYIMRVFVINENSGLAIDAITFENSSGEKVSRSNVLFNNSYVEEADELEVKKEVSGSGADTTKDFNFTVTFSAPATIGKMADGTAWDASQITAVKKDASGASTQTNVSVGSNGVASFTLKHGEEVVFGNLPVGATYIVRETGLAASGYTPTGQAVQNSQSRTALVGRRDTDFTSNSAYVGESTNSYTITNTADEITITGLVIDNLPIILLALLAVAGIATYSVIRRKMMAR